MALSPEKLASIVKYNSQTLCNENAQGVMKTMEKNKRSGVNMVDVDPNTYSDEWDNFSLSSESPAPQTQMYESFNPERVANSKLPDAIKQSLINHPITASDPLKEMVTNYTTQTPQTTPSFTDLPKQKQVITEQRSYQPTNNTGIDYNYLKYIISECIREELAKQPLNENATLRQIGLSEGKIKLVDNKGNIFTAQLEFDGNIRDKKKK